MACKIIWRHRCSYFHSAVQDRKICHASPGYLMANNIHRTCERTSPCNVDVVAFDSAGPAATRAHLDHGACSNCAVAASCVAATADRCRTNSERILVPSQVSSLAKEVPEQEAMPQHYAKLFYSTATLGTSHNNRRYLKKPGTSSWHL